MTRVLLGTSVLIGPAPGDLEGAISAAALTELHFGALLATDSGARVRAQRLGVIEATFDPIAVDAAVPREWGRLAAAVAERGGGPRRRAIDLAIAATANVHEVPLLTAGARLTTIGAGVERPQGAATRARAPAARTASESVAMS